MGKLCESNFKKMSIKKPKPFYQTSHTYAHMQGHTHFLIPQDLGMAAFVLLGLPWVRI